MNPRSCDELKKTHFLCPLFFCLKDNIKTAHWVGQSQLRLLDTNDFFKRTPVVDEIQYSVNGNAIEKSASGKNNPDLLQEEEEQEYEETNDDADVNPEANKIDKNTSDMFISME